MSFYTDNFGTYNDYLDWNGTGQRLYIIKLINNDISTTELVQYNPSGIEKFGLQLDRHEVYHGIFENTSLDLSFSMKNGGGGQYLKSAYDNKGIKANVSAEIYRYNPEINDFFLLYDYEINFQSDSYKYESTDKGNIISVKLNQKGIVSKFGARDEIELDITKNISIGGVTVTDVTKNAIIFPGIDIYLSAEAKGLYWNFNIVRLSSPTPYPVNVSVSPTYGELIRDQTEGRAILETIVDSKIYINDTEENRYIRLFLNMPYTWTIYTPGLVSFGTIYVYFRIYDSTDTKIYEYLVDRFDKLTRASIVQSGSGTINFDSGTYNVVIGGGGYAKLIVELVGETIFGGSYTYIFNTNNGNGTYTKISEKSLSIGNTTNSCYRSYNLATKLMRLICDKNNSLVTGYMQGMDLKNTFFTSGWLLRKYNKNFVISFMNFFKSLSYSEGVGLDYYSLDDRFNIREIEYYYQDVQIIDFGIVKNFRSYPSNDYYSSIKAGCDQSGKYEDIQGALEFNLRYNYSTDYETNVQKNMLIPIHTDSLGIELTRRKQYKYNAAEDTEYDNDIFMVYTDGSQVIVSSALTGFDGVENYYNDRFLAYSNILRNKGILGGIFWKDTTNKLRYISNTKYIEVEKTIGFITYSNKDDINQVDLAPAFFYPEIQEFESVITIDQLQSLRLNPYGYYQCTDEDNLVHYGYFKTIDIQDSEKTIKVIGLTANINRRDE